MTDTPQRPHAIYNTWITRFLLNLCAWYGIKPENGNLRFSVEFSMTDSETIRIVNTKFVLCKPNSEAPLTPDLTAQANAAVLPVGLAPLTKD